MLAVLVQMGLLIIAQSVSTVDWRPSSTWLLSVALLLIPDCWALAWVSIWMSVRQRSMGRALNAVLWRLVILPWGAYLLFVHNWIKPGWFGPESLDWTGYVVVSLMADFGFGLLARKRLHGQLRFFVSEPPVTHWRS